MADTPTPFVTRLSAVWLSLRTRWLYVLLTAVFALGCIVFAWQVDQQGTQSPHYRPVLSWQTNAKPALQIGVPGAGTDSPAEARSLTTYAPLSSWQERQDLPLLKEASLITPATGEDLAWLARQPRLTELRLTTTPGMTAEDLSQLRRATQLTKLNIIDDAAYRGDEAILWPPNLQVVELSGSHELSLQRLQELSRLPHLHTLSVRLHPAFPDKQLPDDIIAALKTFPALHRLYLKELPSLAPDLAETTQAALPGVRVRPATYNATLLSQLAGIVLLLCLWTSIVGVMLSPQFVSPQSVLLPGYRAPHTVVSGLLLLTGLVTVAALLWWAGLDLLTAIGICGGVLTYTGLMIAGLRRIEPGIPGFTQPFLAFPIFVFLVPVLTLLQWLVPGEIAWFLRGKMPAASAMLILAGAALTWNSGRWLTSLHREVEAFGRGGCPLGVDFEGWKQWSLAVNKFRPQNQDWRKFLTGSDQRLTQTMERRPPTSAGRRRLWMAADEMSPARAALLMVVFSVLSFVPIIAWGMYVAGEEVFEPKVLVGGLAYAAIMAIYLPAILLYQRQTYFSMELLRPVTRTEWVNDWFMLAAYALVPPLVMTMGAILAGTWLDRSTWPPITYWPPLLVLLGGAWLTVWGGELLAVTYHWAAVVVMVILVIVACGMFAMSVSSQRFVFEAWLKSLPGMWTLAGASILLGMGLCWCARQRWLTREFAA